MRSFQMLQYLMTDSLSLLWYSKTYNAGEVLSVKNLGNNLYEQMHHSCRGVPEQYLEEETETWSCLDKCGNKAQRLRDVFTRLLPKFADEYLEATNELVYLKESKTNDWQLSVQLISPLLMVSSFMFLQHPKNFRRDESVLNFILRNTVHTALPAIPSKTIGKYGSSGIRDMHFHLAASMEADCAVLRLMRNPRRILENIPMMPDTIIQTCGYVSKKEINTDVSRLCFFERVLADNVFGVRRISDDDFACLHNVDFDYHRSTEMSNLYEKCSSGISDLQFEALLIHRTLYELNNVRGRDLLRLEKAFHIYILLFGKLRTFAVMQQGDAGLIGFNRYLKYDVRIDDQETSVEIFKQLIGNDPHSVKYIEIRFGKLLPDKLVQLIEAEKRFREYLQPDDIKIAHVALLIKRPEKTKTKLKNEALRRVLSNRVAELCSNDGRQLYNAVDVAGRDYEVRPDVFAPVFRHLREAGYKQFTYHAGEDFFHLLGGLRAIYEAVSFLNLGKGCRISHACAAGIAPRLWSNVLGGEVRMSRGEYLDDLIFTNSFINSHNIAIPKKNRKKLMECIDMHSYDVYGRTCTVDDLTQAWEKRAEEPSIYIDNPLQNDVERLVVDYHDSVVRERYEEEIVVNCYEVLNEVQMVKLQKALLGYIASKEVAIETLPTSNVFIGFHQSFHSYHLKQWIDWKFCKRLMMPAILIGSDEPGILCTNIMTEYANICDMLESANDMMLSKKSIPRVLRALADDSKKYEFS